VNGIRTIILLAISLLTGGCGIVSPQIQEFWGTPQDAGLMQQRLVGRISCELRQAVYKLYWDDQAAYKRGEHPLRYAFLKSWLAQIELILTIEEKSSLNPQVSLIDPLPNATTFFSGGRSIETSRSFTLGFGGSLANTATRIDKIYLKYKVSEFVNIQNTNRTCDPPQTNGSLFITSELGIYDWLRGAVSVAVAEGPESQVEAQARFAATAEALSHDIKFQIVTSGNVNPTWKLVRFGTDSSPLANASRDRAQPLILTLAPPDQARPNQLGPAGNSASISSDIAASIRRVLP
jgi:hypothetical protein